MSATKSQRATSVTTSLGPGVLLFHSMQGSDELGQLSQYRVQLLSTEHDVQIADVLGKPMAVHLALPDSSMRHFHGLVTRFCSTGWLGEFACYEATVAPALWLLTRSSNCRIFQDKSVIDIVKEVCQDKVYNGLINLSISLSASYEPLPYCVQYRETDFNFVCRLLESAGIYFFFKHEERKHVMVLADSNAAHAKIKGYESVQFIGERGRTSGLQEGVFAWSASGEIQASKYVLNDFDFEKVAASNSGGLLAKATLAAAFSQAQYELYDYPGRYLTASAGDAAARSRIESVNGQCARIRAESNARGLFAGGLFSLAQHPRDDQNQQYLLTAVSYHIVGATYTSSGEQITPVLCNCYFSALSKTYHYRPLSTIPKPMMQGPQTAMVVGKADEEIWTDKYGRVKVQFHWDRLGKEDEKSSCWVRVSQSWAGKGWGTIFIPRIGMEVIVSFLEGDPDQPLVTGCVYNADAMPPYALPGAQTQSGMRSQTSKGGSGFNEIRFDDKKNAEEIFIQAEGDFHRIVKNNDTLKVGFEKKDKGNQTIAIKHDQSLEVGNDQQIKIAQDQNVTIKGDQKVTVSKTITIEANSSIELKVGASSIKLEAGKITLKAAEIMLQADANVTLKAGAMMEIKAGAVLTVGGSLVKIN